MCTVTYVPKGNDSFILTSNRDENAARSPKNVSMIGQKGVLLAFPRDEKAGGTWIAMSGDNRVVCLLNGAFQYHKHEPPYKRSRGIMVLDFFTYANADDFFEDYDFLGMEPFTIIIYDRSELFEFRWDGKRKYHNPLDPYSTHIWSSSTLYDEVVKSKRRKWFDKWQQEQSDYTLENIMHFHRNAGDGDPYNDVVMNRDGRVQTVSITNIIKEPHQVEMLYHDLLNTQLKRAKIKLQGEVVESR